MPLSAFVLDAAGAVVGMLFPFASRGDLKENVNTLNPNGQKLRWVHDIVSALQYISDCGQIYEDIKAANIVVFDDGQARFMVEELLGISIGFVIVLDWASYQRILNARR